jgi:hypothetical protein
MPKLVDYPRASLKSALELAEAVDSLGGNSSVDMAATKLEKKVSGAFNAQISAANKYGLVESKSQKLSVTQLFRDYKLAYDDEERSERLRDAMLNVPLFKDICSRFAGKELPLSHFEKLLIREFSVPDDWGSRIGSYFIEGGKASGLLDESNRVVGATSSLGPSESLAEQDEAGSVANPTTKLSETPSQPSSVATNPVHSLPVDGKYRVQITGPSMNSVIEIHEADD